METPDLKADDPSRVTRPVRVAGSLDAVASTERGTSQMLSVADGGANAVPVRSTERDLPSSRGGQAHQEHQCRRHCSWFPLRPRSRDRDTFTMRSNRTTGADRSGNQAHLGRGSGSDRSKESPGLSDETRGRGQRWYPC
jgi:hypothetical protein